MNIEKQLQQLSLAVSYVVQNMDGFSDFQALQVAAIYPDWHTGVDYRTGQIARYEGSIYRCVQNHTSQSDWTPDMVASLWNKVTFTEVIENWEQPTGAHDAYNVGDHVMHNGIEWVSLINGNVWEPSESSTVWEIVKK